MPFEKGHKKLGGRKQGIPNKSTTQIRELLNSVLQEEIERIPEHFNAITDPKQRLDALAKLLPFIAPKMQSIKEVKQEGNQINKIEVEIIKT
tara:strand:- start:63 stop:338 length:276 start_codon:yes stop_codon:yes gene_type:complete